jgi:protein-S-isoprenylcysteine O-methyltransferase Ste14
MRRTPAAIGSAVFFALAPGIVAGYGPWLLTGWRMGARPYWAPVRVAGAILVLAGAAVLVQAFVRFVVEGLGTPAPIAPTEHLVVGGLYRYVRNPMYLAVVTTVIGQALLLSRSNLFWYAAVVATLMASFAHWYEAPALRRQFGAEYDEYRRQVPGWLPRLPLSRRRRRS